MTKKLILVFSILFFELNAQDYIEYYRKSMNYDMIYDLEIANSKSKAIDTVKEKKLLNLAIEIYNVTPDKHYFYAHRANDLFYPLYLINDKENLAKYMSEYSCLFSKEDMIDILKELIDYEKISFSDEILLSYTKLIDDKIKCNKPIEIKSKLNQDSFFKTLSDRDQEYRGKIKNVEKEILNDSINFEEIKSYLTNYGYPNFKSSNSRRRFNSILFHIDNFKRFKRIEPILFKAVLDGKLHPSDYAYAYDRSLIGSDLKPKYYWLIKGSLIEETYKPESYNLIQVNEDRYKIGLPVYPNWIGKIRH